MLVLSLCKAFGVQYAAEGRGGDVGRAKLACSTFLRMVNPIT